MSIYAIGDLHLATSPDIDKPMDGFGPLWVDHTSRFQKYWKEMIGPEDTVIVPGDISWGLRYDEALPDLQLIDGLPGKKIFVKGNHDLWWTSITKLNKAFETITFLQNDCIYCEGIYICGSRGWITPDNDDFTQSDDVVYKRELLRMKMSLDAAAERQKEVPGEILGVMHFPPVSKKSAFSGFQQLFMDRGVKKAIYGHVHGEEGFKTAIQGPYHGTEYHLVSLDYLRCIPFKVK